MKRILGSIGCWLAQVAIFAVSVIALLAGEKEWPE